MPNPTFSPTFSRIHPDTPLIFGVKKLRVNKRKALSITLVTMARQVIFVYDYSIRENVDTEQQDDRQVDIIFQKDNYIMVIREGNNIYTSFGKLASVFVMHPIRGEKVGKKVEKNN